jgi:hypothetical protein
MSMKEPPAARGTRRGTVTATADEGFPTPSSSGREASGAAKITNDTVLHTDVHSITTFKGHHVVKQRVHVLYAMTFVVVVVVLEFELRVSPYKHFSYFSNRVSSFLPRSS